VYLPPLREEPRRYYRADHGWVRELMKQLQSVDDWLHSAAINAEVRVDLLDSNEGIVAVYLCEGSQLNINLRDVGSGVSQVLPVIVGSLQALEGRLIIVEQPELHLHPSAQAGLADVFINIIMRKSRPLAPSFLIETHSESLLLRLRVRLAQTTAYKDQQKLKLCQDDFGAIFVERDGLKANVEMIEFDELGAYIRQPKGFIEFFGDDFYELQKLRRARSDAANIEKE
jgi:predicted ATPase